MKQFAFRNSPPLQPEDGGQAKMKTFVEEQRNLPENELDPDVEDMHRQADVISAAQTQRENEEPKH